MANIVGAFVFRNEGDGCITGKYFNNGMKVPYTEGARLIEDATSNEFVGTYSTSWLNDENAHEKAYLKIEPKDNSTTLFSLKWSADINGINIKYKGEAMMFEGLLTGYYWSMNMDERISIKSV